MSPDRRGTRANRYLLEEDEEDIYDVVAEEDYRDLVKKRQEREDFVVDDDGIGYIDDGEEHQLNDEECDEIDLQNKAWQKKLHGPCKRTTVLRTLD